MTNEKEILGARYTVRAIYSAERGWEIPEKPEEIGYSDIYRAARRHTYAGALYSLIYKRLAAIPEEARAIWERESMNDAAKNIAQLEAFSEVEAILTEHKIPYLPLKGIILKSLWQNPNNRPMSDIDVFVGERAADAISALTEAGYELKDALHDFHTTVKKSPYVSVELHNDIYNGAGKSTLDYKPCEDNPYRLKMSHTELIVFIVRHARHHYENGGSCGIRLPFDLRFYLEKYSAEIDKDELGASLLKSGLTDFYDAAIAIAEFWFDGKDLPEKYREIEEYMLLGGSFGNTETMLRQTEKKGTTLKYIFHICFPPYKNMASQYPVLRKWKILLPVYYVKRGFEKLVSGKVSYVAKTYKEARKENKNK